jgi:D-alanine-D-alanine ligase
VIVKGVTARELLCGVLGDVDEPMVSAPAEVKVSGGWSDYDQKYLGVADVVTVPAKLPPDVTEEVRDLSARAFQAIGGHGLARVDFFYDEAAGKVYVGEINTMPGFTSRSVYARCLGASGLSYEQVVDRLVDLALARYASRSRLEVER